MLKPVVQITTVLGKRDTQSIWNSLCGDYGGIKVGKTDLQSVYCYSSYKALRQVELDKRYQSLPLVSYMAGRAVSSVLELKAHIFHQEMGTMEAD